MTNEIMSAILSLCLTGGGENALLKVTAVDDAGCAVSNAEVTVSALCKYYFGVGGRSSDWAEFKSCTDVDGTASVKFKMYGNRFKWSVRAEGYYSPGQKAEYFQFKENKDLTCTLLEGEREVRAVLYRKRNPKPMYAYPGFAFKRVPKSAGRFGFDLRCGDWVSPVGKGEVADFYVLKGWDSVSNEFGRLEFPKGAGAYIGKQTGNNGFPSVYEANTNACFESEFSYKGEELNVIENGSRNTPSVEKDEYMVLRTRVCMDDSGNIVRANYSKIVGPFEINADIQMLEVVFNGEENDPNLELDSKRNHIKKYRMSDLKP